jgi:hypothetical protein
MMSYMEVILQQIVVLTLSLEEMCMSRIRTTNYKMIPGLYGTTTVVRRHLNSKNALTLRPARATATLWDYDIRKINVRKAVFLSLKN